VLLALAALLLAAVAALPLAPVGQAAAQTSTSGEATLRLVQQTPWVGPDGTFQVAVRGDGLPAGATVQGEIHSRVRSRSALATAFDDRTGAPIFRTPMRPVTEASPLGDGTIVISFPVTGGTPTEPGEVQLDSSPGVYPFVVRVYDAGGDVLADLTTALIRLGPEQAGTAGRLSVGTVVPVAATITLADEGTPALDDQAADDLDATVTELAARPDVALTLVPSAESLALLGTRGPDGEAAVAALRGRAGRQVLGGPYAPIDTGGWVAAGLVPEMADQWAAGTATLEALLGSRPDPTIAVLDPTVTSDALGWLTGLGVEAAVVPTAQLEPLTDRTEDAAFAQQFQISAGEDRSIRAVIGDDATSGRLADDDDPVLAAHRALAELAMLHVLRPGTARGAAVVVPRDTDPQALSTFLAALADPSGASSGSVGAAMVAPVTLTDLFAATGEAEVTRNGRTTVLERAYRSDPPAGMGAYPTSLRASRDELDGLRSLVPTSPQLVEPIATTILSSGSRELDPDERQDMLAAADGAVRAVTSEIVVSPEQVVTLTSSSGRIPLNLENRLQVEARVRIVMNSAKLDFPEGEVIETTLSPAQTTTIDLPVETRASGAFPLTVTISSADGDLPVATSTYTVRSTAISGVGLVLSVGAGLFLLVWWARHWRTARRARKLVASTHPAISGSGPAGYAPAHTEPRPDAALDPEPPTALDPEPPTALDPDPMEGR